MFLDDIADFLEGKNVTTTVGDMPANPDNCVAIYEFAGEPLETALGISVERPGLQVKVRNLSYLEGRQLAQEIQKELHALKDQRINGTRYIYIYAKQSVESLGRDKNERSLFVQNFIVSKEY